MANYKLNSHSSDSFLSVARAATQAEQFLTRLHGAGWRSLNSFESGGHVFEMLLFRTGTLLLIQIYPDGHGFDVWRPITAAPGVEETWEAVLQYAQSGATAEVAALSDDKKPSPSDGRQPEDL